MTWIFCDDVWPPIVMVAVYSPGGTSAPDCGPLLKSLALSQRTGPSARRSQYIRCKPALVGTHGTFFGFPELCFCLLGSLRRQHCCCVCDGLPAAADARPLCSALCCPSLRLHRRQAEHLHPRAASRLLQLRAFLSCVRTTWPCESVITSCPGSFTSLRQEVAELRAVRWILAVEGAIAQAFHLRPRPEAQRRQPAETGATPPVRSPA